MYDDDPRVNAYGRTHNYAQAQTQVRQDLMGEYKCTEQKAGLIMLIAYHNNYNYPFAINAVINEGATAILYNERHSGDGIYIYTKAYITNTGKLIGKEIDNCRFTHPQNCYKHGGFN
jgi:hypothetical protein